MRRTGVMPYRAVLSAVLALLLGWASVSEAGRRGGGRGGHGFHGGRGSGSHSGFHGHRGGQFHGNRRHHGGFRHHDRHGGFRHHGFRGKAFIGVAPLFLWGPSYIYTPPPVYVRPEPVGYWYFCPSARAYYPYVASCPEAWIPVPAR
jgi:hypothetical protein